ncbi:MAG: hypothetical protein Kilf2KO_11930 [Rhodospirillales bacterium]
MTLLKDDPVLAAAALAPARPYADASAAPGDLAYLAATYNRIGGLLDLTAERLELETPHLLAIWLALSGGITAKPGRLPLRIDLKRLFNRWGKDRPKRFDRHFRFGGRQAVAGAAWQNQQWRPDEEEDWRAAHIGDAAREGAVFELVSSLANEEVASQATTFGEPQIPGFLYGELGYETAAGLYAACRLSERWQVCALGDLLRSQGMVAALRAEDWRAMTEAYKGLVAIATVGRRLAEAYECALELESLERQADADREEAHGERFALDGGRALALNLRQGPAPAPVIAVLHAGDAVEKRGVDPKDPRWWDVEAKLGSQRVTGWLNSDYLKPYRAPDPADLLARRLPSAHMARAQHARSDGFGRIFPLNEEDLHKDLRMPSRNARTPLGRRKQMLTLARYLDPAKPEHARYRGAAGEVFDAVYAYDLACLAGVYLPRVWWSDRALAALGAGRLPRVHYGVTVKEMSINGLFDWFAAFGEDYGWRRTFDLDSLQAAANRGSVCFVIAQHQAVNQPGHLAALLPESKSLEAHREADRVVRPLQSLADAKTRQPGVPASRWWLGRSYRDFAFWHHD